VMMVKVAAAMSAIIRSDISPSLGKRPGRLAEIRYVRVGSILPKADILGLSRHISC